MGSIREELSDLRQFYRSVIDDTTYWGNKVNPLFIEYRETGNEKLLEKAVLSRIRLSIKFALKYRLKTIYMDLSDLTAEAMIGLYKAAKDFDPEHEKGADFSTFSYKYIKREIYRAIQEHERAVRLSARTFRELSAIDNETYLYMAEKGVRPSTEEISRKLWIPSQRIDKIKFRAQTPFSINYEEVRRTSNGKPMDPENQETFLKNDPFPVIQEDISGKDELEQILKRAKEMNLIDSKRFEILEMSFFKGMNNKQIGRIRGTTHQAVSELKIDTLKKLSGLAKFIDSRPERYAAQQESREIFGRIQDYLETSII